MRKLEELLALLVLHIKDKNTSAVRSLCSLILTLYVRGKLNIDEYTELTMFIVRHKPLTISSKFNGCYWEEYNVKQRLGYLKKHITNLRTLKNLKRRYE